MADKKYFTNINGEYYVQDNERILKSSIFTLDNFEGETNEDKLYNALNTIDGGFILCGEINLTKQYTPLDKDYRKIYIVNAHINLKINNWWVGTGRQYNYVPRFINCYLDSINQYIMFKGNNLVGLELRNCYINDLSLYINDNNTGSGPVNFIQSFVMSGCSYWNDNQLLKGRQFYDCKLLDNRIEAGNGTIIESIYDESYSCYNLNIENNVIESRRSGCFKLKSVINGTFKNNYLEGNEKHLVEITGTKSSFNMIIENNFILETDTSTDYIFYLTGNILPRTKCFNNSLLFSGETTRLINTSVPTSIDRDFYENYGTNSNKTYNAYAGLVKTTKGFNAITPTLNSNGKWEFEYCDYRSIQNDPSPLILSISYGFQGSSLYRSNAVYVIAFGYYYNGSTVVPTVKKKLLSCFSGSTFDDKTETEDIIETITIVNTDIKRIKITLKTTATNNFCKVNVIDLLNTFQLTNRAI